MCQMGIMVERGAAMHWLGGMAKRSAAMQSILQGLHGQIPAFVGRFVPL